MKDMFDSDGIGEQEEVVRRLREELRREEERLERLKERKSLREGIGGWILRADDRRMTVPKFGECAYVADV